jgi:hypothetical protein
LKKEKQFSEVFFFLNDILIIFLSQSYRSFGAFAINNLIHLPTMESNLNTNNKRSANDGNDYQDNTNNIKKTRTTKVDLRFLLASRMKNFFQKKQKKNFFFIIHFKNLGDAGAIIGRQGKNIQMLRSKYKTIIQVPVRKKI